MVGRRSAPAAFTYLDKRDYDEFFGAHGRGVESSQEAAKPGSIPQSPPDLRLCISTQLQEVPPSQRTVDAAAQRRNFYTFSNHVCSQFVAFFVELRCQHQCDVYIYIYTIVWHFVLNKFVDHVAAGILGVRTSSQGIVKKCKFQEDGERQVDPMMGSTSTGISFVEHTTAWLYVGDLHPVFASEWTNCTCPHRDRLQPGLG